MKTLYYLGTVGEERSDLLIVLSVAFQEHTVSVRLVKTCMFLSEVFLHFGPATSYA